MTGALAVIAEAILRIEYKLDLLLSAFFVAEGPPPPAMKFGGHTCPVCRRTVEYQVDLLKQIVKRVCDCSTGKQPPLVPLIPDVPEEPNHARRDPADEDREASAEDGPRRKGR